MTDAANDKSLIAKMKGEATSDESSCSGDPCCRHRSGSLTIGNERIHAPRAVVDAPENFQRERHDWRRSQHASRDSPHIEKNGQLIGNAGGQSFPSERRIIDGRLERSDDLLQ